MNNVKKTCNARGFVSLVLTFSCIVLLVSGIVLYIAPNCRFARDTGWSVLYISKETWESLHIVFSFVFIISAVFHFIYNMNLFFRYIVDKIKGKNVLKTEAVVSLILVAVIFVMAAWKVPPVGWIVDLHDTVKSSWFGDAGRNEGPGFQRGRGYHRGQGEGRRGR